MLVRVFNMQDNGFSALLQLDEGLKLVRVRGIDPYQEDFWKERVSDVASHLEPGVALEDFVSTLSDNSGIYNILDVVQDKDDSELDAVFMDALKTWGATTGTRVFASPGGAT